ncbi:MAG: RNA polymerase sigma factor [Bryobacteraceae bacterium]
MVVSEADLNEREAAGAFLANGSEESFRALYRVLYAKLVRYFMARALSQATAEELTQDVLLTIYRRAGTLQKKECFFGWLFKIAANCHRRHLRRARRDVETVGLDAPESIGSKRNDIAELDRAAEFLHWMELLEPIERRIMMLRYVEELGYQEIATALSLPLGTVKWKIYSAKERLSAQLAPQKRVL